MSFFEPQAIEKYPFFKKDLPIVGAGTICLIRPKKKTQRKSKSERKREKI